MIIKANRICSEAQASIYAAQSAYTFEIQQIESNVNRKKFEFQSAAEKEIPYPDYPIKPKYLRETEKKERDARKGRKTRLEGMTPAQKRNENLKYAILDNLRYFEPITVSDMIEKIPKFRKESVQHLSTLCHSLLDAGKIGKITYKRKTYYIVKE